MILRWICAVGLMVSLATSSASAWSPFPKPPTVEQVVQITAKNSTFSPAIIQVKAGQPVVLEITAVDDDHSFYLRAFGVMADIPKGKTVRVRFTPTKAGAFEFHCDDWCGEFHDEMEGKVVVTE